MQEFIERAKIVMQPEKDFLREKNRRLVNEWNNNNREKLHEIQKKYAETEKGQQAIKKRAKNRYDRFRNACIGLTSQEKRKIKTFYRKCPEGYVVDHIIPLAKGGLHRIENLQYLTFMENALKATKILCS
jgi:5-methylcytosine-specific restriction endonuclease McrA